MDDPGASGQSSVEAPIWLTPSGPRFDRAIDEMRQSRARRRVHRRGDEEMTEEK